MSRPDPRQREVSSDPAELQNLRNRVELLSAQLEAVKEELRVANDEMGAFSHSVSHDLRSPLAAVQGYVQFFLEDHGSSVSPAGKELLQEAIAGAVRMSRLIEDLQTYSRLSRQPLEKHIIPLRPLVLQVLQTLEAQEQQRAPTRRIEARIGDLGDCACDPTLLEQVFVQLLGNAFKFARGRDTALIEVQRLQQGRESVFQVRDNGVGFDMQYAHQLFGVFQRLHAAGQFEGRGIGLCIAQRIVQRHGGRMWAHATPGKGATLFFTLPGSPL